MTTFRARHSRSSALFATVVATLSVALLHLCICIPLCPIQSISNQSCPSTEEHLLLRPVFAEPTFGQSGEIFHSAPRWMDGFGVDGRKGRSKLSQMRRKGQNAYWVSRKKVDVTGKTPFRSRMSLQIFFAIRHPKKSQINPNAIMRGQKKPRDK